MTTATVEILSGPDQGKVVPFKNDKMTFGRHESSDISLDGKKVSRNHATIALKGGQFVITDLGSKNRTRINGEPITEKFLKNGDEITIGEFTLRFRCQGEDEATVEEHVAPMPGADEDDGTQLVDMNALLKGGGSSSKAATKPAPAKPAAKSTAPKPVPEVENVERTDVIDVNQLLAKSGPVKAPSGKTTAPPDQGRNTPQNIKFARTEEGGNIEEGTDLLNMEDILGDENAPKVREVSPVFFAAAGFGIILVVLVFMAVRSTFMTNATARQESKQKVGVNAILNLPVDPANDFVPASQTADQDLIQTEYFLSTYNKATNQKFYHFALVPQFPGKTTMVLTYQNGDQLLIDFLIEDTKKPVIPGSREEKIAAAQKALAVGKENFSKRQNAAENLRLAYRAYAEVLDILGQVEFGTFLEEYEQAKEGLKETKSEINNRYKDIEGDFELAEKREDKTGAVEVLKKMLEFRLGDNDINYLKNKARLEYKYGETIASSR